MIIKLETEMLMVLERSSITHLLITAEIFLKERKRGNELKQMIKLKY